MKQKQKQKLVFIVIVAASICTPFLPVAKAASVPLQQATATFPQAFNGSFLIGAAIDGFASGNGGWAILQNDLTTTSAATAAFETVNDVGFAGGSLLTFTLTQTYTGSGGAFPQHTIGRFRLSVTTDDCSLFADGLSSGGNVSANWIMLDPTSNDSLNGATLDELGDFSILASGLSPATDIYSVVAPTALTGITGIRLEVLEDPSLPTNGPGRYGNGNFVLTEFQVDIAPTTAPEPSSLALLVATGTFLVGLRRRKSTAKPDLA